MTEKEIAELNQENDRLNRTNTILLNALVKLIGEYNAMLAAISRHSANIKTIVDALNRPSNARNLKN